MPPEHTPIYLDWTFWAFVVAAVAVALSQLPPIKLWFSAPKLFVDTYERINIHHTLGNPNVNFFLMLENRGGKSLRVHSIRLDFSRERTTFSLPAKTYFPGAAEKGLIFVPFDLQPARAWTNSVFFGEAFGREDERTVRQLTGALKEDIVAKRQQPGNENRKVEADPVLVAPLLAFFERHFLWIPGEYTLKVVVTTDPAEWSATKALRFTLYETDSTELRSYTAQYAYGLGVYFFDLNRQAGVHVPVIPI